jgi:hypoxanthine phosphoribosyltransferase
MERVLGGVLISSADIERRTGELGRQISLDYSGTSVTLVAILKGSFIFLADIIRNINPEIPVEVDFMSVSSYGDSTSSSGTIVIEKDIEVKIEGRDIIIVEDIVDSGLTLTHVFRILRDKGARSIRVATLLEKPGNSKYEGKLDYVGFQIPNSFVVGYGLDFAQRYRNLPDIRVLHERSECKPERAELSIE